MTVSNARIVLHFDVHEPVELTELTLSFGSLARQYKKFLSDKATSEIMLQVAQYYAGNQILLNYEKETNTVLKSRKRIYQDALRIADAEELKRPRTNFSEGIDLSEYKIKQI